MIYHNWWPSSFCYKGQSVTRKFNWYNNECELTNDRYSCTRINQYHRMEIPKAFVRISPETTVTLLLIMGLVFPFWNVANLWLTNSRHQNTWFLFHHAIRFGLFCSRCVEIYHKKKFNTMTCFIYTLDSSFSSSFKFWSSKFPSSSICS